jgi:hypothetical protein
MTANVPLTDAVAAVEQSFFNFRKNENRKIKSQITENQRLRLSAVRCCLYIKVHYLLKNLLFSYVHLENHRLLSC